MAEFKDDNWEHVPPLGYVGKFDKLTNDDKKAAYDTLREMKLPGSAFEPMELWQNRGSREENCIGVFQRSSIPQKICANLNDPDGVHKFEFRPMLYDEILMVYTGNKPISEKVAGFYSVFYDRAQCFAAILGVDNMPSNSYVMCFSLDGRSDFGCDALENMAV